MTEIGAFVEWMIYLVVTMMILAVWWQVKVATSTRIANRFLIGVFGLSLVGYFFYYLFVLVPRG